MKIGHRTIGLSAAVVTLSALAVSGATTASGGPRHAVTPSASKAGWVQLSSGKGVSSSTSIGLGGFDGQTEAVWTQTHGGASSLKTRSIDDAGHAVSAAQTVVSDWVDLNSFPAIFESGGTREIAFSGLKSTDDTDPYSMGYEYEATSADGTSWTLGTGALSAGNKAFGSYGSDVVNANGTPVLVYTQGSAAAVSFREGSYPTIPTTTPPDDSTTTPTGSDSYFAGVGYDVNSGETEAAWASNATDKDVAGVSEQMIEPVLGSRVHAPKSASKFHGHYTSNAYLQQRLQVASPPDGGAFVAYPVGYPNSHKVAIWQLGSGHVLVRKAGGVATRVDAAPGNGATLWLIWWDKGSSSIQLVHTTDNAIDAATQCSVALPPHTGSVWDIEGWNVGKHLALFVNSGKNTSLKSKIYSRIVGCPKAH